MKKTSINTSLRGAKKNTHVGCDVQYRISELDRMKCWFVVGGVAERNRAAIEENHPGEKPSRNNQLRKQLLNHRPFQ